QHLQQTGRDDEARKFRRRLEILDPGGRTAAPATPGLATAPAAPPAPEGGPTARAKGEEDDPFADANQAPPRESGALARAEQAFSEKRYGEACGLYEEAHAADPGAAASCRERWAYCKMFRVVEALNGAEKPAAPAELEREVRQALSMAPKLEKF